MSHLIITVLVIVNTLLPNLADSTSKTVDKSKFHGVWQIEDIRVSQDLAIRGPRLDRHLGDFVIWDTHENMVIGLPLVEFVRLEFRPGTKSNDGAMAINLRHLDTSLRRKGNPGLVLAADKRLLACYALSEKGEAPSDFEVESSPGMLISLVLRRAANDDGIKATREIVAKMQGKWSVVTAIVTNDRGEPTIFPGGTQGTVHGNVLEIERLDNKYPGKTYRVLFGVNGAERPARIYTRDFCGILGFDERGLLKIAGLQGGNFNKLMVPKKLDPPDSLDDIGPRKIYMVLRPIEEKKP